MLNGYHKKFEIDLVIAHDISSLGAPIENMFYIQWLPFGLINGQIEDIQNQIPIV